VKSRAERSRDIERVLEQVDERVRNVVGVRRLGGSFDLATYRAGNILVEVEPQFHDGQLWLRLRVSRAGAVNIEDLVWCRDTFAGPGGALVITPHARGGASVYSPAEQDPIPRFTP
jgi:hypothetical protein